MTEFRKEFEEYLHLSNLNFIFSSGSEDFLNVGPDERRFMIADTEENQSDETETFNRFGWLAGYR
jgi:hypothetical protein